MHLLKNFLGLFRDRSIEFAPKSIESPLFTRIYFLNRKQTFLDTQIIDSSDLRRLGLRNVLGA
jgi:hypothetical protein